MYVGYGQVGGHSITAEPEERRSDAIVTGNERWRHCIKLERDLHHHPLHIEDTTSLHQRKSNPVPIQRKVG